MRETKGGFRFQLRFKGGSVRLTQNSRGTCLLYSVSRVERQRIRAVKREMKAGVEAEKVNTVTR